MKKTVLVVDDDKSILKLCDKILRSNGYDVVTASYAPEGLLKFSSASIDLIISDLNMSGNDGIWLIQQIREKDQNIKVILMSGEIPIPDRVREAMRSYAVAFIKKPFLIEDLISLVNKSLKVLRKARVKDERYYRR